MMANGGMQKRRRADREARIEDGGWLGLALTGRQTDIRNVGGVEGFGGVAFLGVEDDDVLDHASFLQNHLYVLRTHARLR